MKSEPYAPLKLNMDIVPMGTTEGGIPTFELKINPPLKSDEVLSDNTETVKE